MPPHSTWNEKYFTRFSSSALTSRSSCRAFSLSQPLSNSINDIFVFFLRFESSHKVYKFTCSDPFDTAYIYQMTVSQMFSTLSMTLLKKISIHRNCLLFIEIINNKYLINFHNFPYFSYTRRTYGVGAFFLTMSGHNFRFQIFKGSNSNHILVFSKNAQKND